MRKISFLLPPPPLLFLPTQYLPITELSACFSLLFAHAPKEVFLSREKKQSVQNRICNVHKVNIFFILYMGYNTISLRNYHLFQVFLFENERSKTYFSFESSCIMCYAHSTVWESRCCESSAWLRGKGKRRGKTAAAASREGKRSQYLRRYLPFPPFLSSGKSAVGLWAPH